MAGTTSIARSLESLRQGKDLPIRLERGARRAAHLLCFLRYVEDNATELGLQLSPTEALSSVGPAYGTAFFPTDRLAGHVGSIAGKLGMDRRSFEGYVDAIAPEEIREALSAFGLEDGNLALTSNPQAGREVNTLFSDTGGRTMAEEGWMSYLSAGLLASGLVRALAEQAWGGRSPRKIRVVDPMCGQGGFLRLTWRALSDAAPEADIELSGWDVSGAAVALASMRLLLDGYRGGFSGLRAANALDPLHEDGGPYDVVVCEPPAAVEAPRGVVLRTADGAPSCLRMCAHLLEGGEGVGAVITPSRALGGTGGATGAAAMADLRRILLRRGFLRGCVEIPGKLPNTGGASYEGVAVWALGGAPDLESYEAAKDRAAAQEAASEAEEAIKEDGDVGAASDAVLLARLDGDGMQRERPGFYQGLRGELEPGGPEATWLGNLVAQRREVPFLSALVSRKAALATEGHSLRLADHAPTMDVGGRLAAAGDLDSAAQIYRQAHEELERAHAAFDTALEELLAFRAEREGGEANGSDK